MKIADISTGIQHIGIPTKDMNKTIAFYESLGFHKAFHTGSAENNDRVVFLQLKDLVIETYETNEAAGVVGAVDHIALNVIDISAAFSVISNGEYTLLDSSIQQLPFWENGVRFFTILGPNKEKIEFSQIL
jgi:lactoylglutathione lyase